MRTLPVAIAPDSVGARAAAGGANTPDAGAPRVAAEG